MMGDEPAPRPIRHPVLFIHTPHPSMRQETTLEPDVPRLAVIREAPDDDAAHGVITRAKVPSWDEIMFGIKPTDEQ